MHANHKGKDFITLLLLALFDVYLKQEFLVFTDHNRMAELSDFI